MIIVLDRKELMVALQDYLSRRVYSPDLVVTDLKALEQNEELDFDQLCIATKPAPDEDKEG